MPDWNDASAEIKSGVTEESRQWAIRELVADFPNRDGIPDRSVEDATTIVTALLGKPYPWMVGWTREDKNRDIMCAEQVVHYANEHDFLYLNGCKTGWIRRDGKLLSCAYAAHDKLLYNILEITTEQAENQGWIRSDHRKWSCLFKASLEQIETLNLINHRIDFDAEQLKPIWSANKVVRTFG